MQTIIESMNSSFDVCHGLVWEQSQISRAGEVLFKGTSTQVAERWHAIRAIMSSDPDEQEVNDFFSEIFEDAAVTEADEANSQHDFSHMSTSELSKHIGKKLNNAAAANLSQRASEHLQAAQKEYKRHTRLGESLEELKANLKGDLVAAITGSTDTRVDEAFAHDVDHMPGRRLSASNLNKTSSYTVATNAINGHKEQKVKVDAASKNHALNLAVDHFRNKKKLVPRVHFDGLRVVSEDVVDEVSAAAMGRAVEHDWTSNLEPSASTQAVKHPKHAGTAINNVNRAHPASNPSGHKFAVLHHDGKGWQVSKHERIETAAREFARHASKPGAKVKIVDGRGAAIHSTFEMEIQDDELNALRESEFIE